MSNTFTLAHFSDPHLGPLPLSATFRNFALKRIIGSLSWNLKRRKFHRLEIADAVLQDIVATKPDHIACTGDIVNIAARHEFPRAAAWLRTAGEAKDVTFVPGNHDAYVAHDWHHGLQPFASFMIGDMNLKDTATNRHIATPFPFVRLRKNVALIGLSTALPQSLTKAAGTLGEAQLKVLALALRDLRERGFARVVLIHHPPFPDLAPQRKALTDAADLRDLIAAEGAELILHGHNHKAMVTPLKTHFGTTHAVGVPSASSNGGHYEPAAWNFYAITRADGRWRIAATTRSLDSATGTLKTTAEFAL